MKPLNLVKFYHGENQSPLNFWHHTLTKVILFHSYSAGPEWLFQDGCYDKDHHIISFLCFLSSFRGRTKNVALKMLLVVGGCTVSAKFDGKIENHSTIRISRIWLVCGITKYALQFHNCTFAQKTQFISMLQMAVISSNHCL